MSADDREASDGPATASAGASAERTVSTNDDDTGPVPAERALLGHALTSGDSDLMRRYAVARYAGLQYGGDRDLYDVLGYDRDPDPKDYYAKYLRNDIARTVVQAPASTAWRVRPNVVDDANEGTEDEDTTAFEQAVEFLFDEFQLLHYLERWDVATGLGEYGVLFLGLREDGDDLPDLSDPVGGDDPNDASSVDLGEVDPDGRGEDAQGGFAYLSVFTQAHVEDIDVVQEPAHPRYGLPHRYQLEFETGDSSRTEWVHHSRVLHAAEDLLENEVFGTPRMKPVYNRIMDLEKVVGGSAEMFWRGARRELHLNYTGDGSPQDKEDLQEQAEEYTHNLRNVLRTSNVEAEDLGGEDVDPSGLVEQLLKLIAGETGIPVRILTGSERGELASTQDRATWLGRVGERQEQFCAPMLLRPLLDRLLDLGVLPEPQGGTYSVEWPDLFELNELEQAELRKTNAQALKEATGGSPFEVADPPEVREGVLGWDPERGGETTLDQTPQDREREVEDEQDPADVDEDALDEFGDILDDVPDGTAQARETVTDGGR